jgi:LCP family protein required for cell wall assembly
VATYGSAPGAQQATPGGPIRPRPAPGSTYGGPPPAKPGGTPGKTGPGRPRKRHSPWWAKISIALGVLVMLGSATAMVGVNVLLGQVNESVKQTTLIDHGAQPVSIDGAINLLMVGLDTRDNNPGMGSRSDSIIIAHIPASHDGVQMISIPRDTYIHIPADPTTKFNGGYDKINAAFQYGSQRGGGDAGGMKLLQKTIGDAYGITFQSALIVNFDGFTDIVNKLHGVTMYVDEKTISLHHGYKTNDPTVRAAPFIVHPDGTPGARIPGTSPVIYQKGKQHLTAYQALDYVRCRDFLPNADYDRQRHQQQFIKALLQEAYDQGISNPTKISNFLKSLSNAFVFDGGGRQLSDWIFTLKGISPSAIVTLKINNGTYNTVMVGKSSTQQMSQQSLELLQDVKNDTVDAFIAKYPTWVAAS